MSIRLEMLQVARLAPKILGDSTELIGNFLRSQQLPDGGFKGRTESSDLYYTVFALEGILALHSEYGPQRAGVLSRAGPYVEDFRSGEGLDFVHLCCLARSSASLRQLGNETSADLHFESGTLLRQIEKFRAEDGGYNPLAGSESGTAYGCFLALGAYQDLREQAPNPAGIVRCLEGLRTDDGAWTNELRPAVPKKVGAANATAAAITVLRNLGQPVTEDVGQWLLRCAHPQGGFLAVPNAPIPDLLSTATALHALAGLEISFDHLSEACLDFVDSLWTNEGRFYGHWQDEHVDCEYTYYGLLALGHLSLCS